MLLQAGRAPKPVRLRSRRPIVIGDTEAAVSAGRDGPAPWRGPRRHPRRRLSADRRRSHARSTCPVRAGCRLERRGLDARRVLQRPRDLPARRRVPSDPRRPAACRGRISSARAAQPAAFERTGDGASGAVGTETALRPRTDPYVRNDRRRLLPRVMTRSADGGNGRGREFAIRRRGRRCGKEADQLASLAPGTPARHREGPFVESCTPVCCRCALRGSGCPLRRAAFQRVGKNMRRPVRPRVHSGTCHSTSCLRVTCDTCRSLRSIMPAGFLAVASAFAAFHTSSRRSHGLLGNCTLPRRARRGPMSMLRDSLREPPTRDQSMPRHRTRAAIALDRRIGWPGVGTASWSGLPTDRQGS